MSHGKLSPVIVETSRVACFSKVATCVSGSDATDYLGRGSCFWVPQCLVAMHLFAHYSLLHAEVDEGIARTRKNTFQAPVLGSGRDS